MHTDLAVKAKATLENFVPVIDKRLAKYFDQEINLDFGFNQTAKIGRQRNASACQRT